MGIRFVADLDRQTVVSPAGDLLRMHSADGKILTDLAHNRDHLEQLRRQGIAYARERLTWDAKAQDTTRVLNGPFGAVQSQTFDHQKR